MRRGWGALPVLALVLAGCQADVKVPSGAQLQCLTSAQCPQDYFCNASNRCVPANQANSTPPDLASPPAVSPAVGRMGTTFHVTIASTKVLHGTPSVALDLIPPVPMQCASTGTQQFDCTYQATGKENGGAGGSVPFDVTLTDAEGNIAVKKSAGYLKMDFLAPSVANAIVTPTNAGRGANVHVFFAVSEPVVGDVVVHSSQPIGGKTSFKATNAAGTPIYTVDQTLQWSADGTGTDPDGPVTFTVTLTDTAGNVSTDLTIGSISVDQLVPTLSNEQTDAKVYSEVAGHNVVTLTFDVAKAVDAPGELVAVLDQSAFTCGQYQATSPNYTCTYDVTGTEGSGAHSIVVHAHDEAGNVSNVTDTVTFDFRKLNLAVTTSGGTLGQGQSPVVLVSSDKAIKQTPQISVTQNGVPATALGMSTVTGGATSWVFAFPPIGPALAGSFDVAVTATDDVGHQATGMKTITVDGVRPTLSGVQTLGSDGSATTLFGKVAPFNQVTLNFNASKPLSNVTASMGALCPPASGSNDLAPCNLHCRSYQLTAPNYTCTYQVTGQEQTADGVVIDTIPQASLPITIQGEDEAGNRATAGTSVTFDFTPPTLVTQTDSQDAIGAGQTENVVFTTNEPLGQTPTVTTTGPAALPFTWAAGSSYTFSYQIQPTDQDGTYQPQITLTDLVGNATTLPGTGFTIDVNVPVIPPANLTTNATRFSALPGFNEIELDFDVTKSLDVPGAAYTVVLGAVCPTAADGICAFHCGAYQPTSPNYSCTYTVTGSELTQGGQAIASLSSANVPILVAGHDEAGNQVTARADVTLDFMPPTLVSASAQPPIAGVYQQESLLLVPSEELSTTPEVNVTGPGSLAFQLVPETTYSFADAIQPTDVPGSYASSVTMTDLVGNTATVPGPAFSADPVVPVISNVKTNAPSYSEVDGFNVVSLSFDVPKAVDAGLTVTLSGQPMSCNSYQGPVDSYTCTYQVDPMKDQAGPQTIAIRTVDEAGNSDATTASVVFDFTPLVLTPTLAPNPAKNGDTPVLVVTTNKPLTQAPKATVTPSGTVSGSLTAPVGVSAGSAWSYTFSAITPPLAGTFKVGVTATDSVGHTATPTPIAFVVDANVPTITNLTTLRNLTTPATSFSEVATYNEVIAAFDVPKSLDGLLAPAGLSVMIGGAPMTCGAFQSTAPNYRCTYPIQGTEGSGAKVITVTAQDAAGNVSVASTTVEFDFAPLTLTAQVSPSQAQLNDIPVLSVTSGKPLAKAPAVTVTQIGAANGTLGSWVVSGLSTAWTFTFSSAQPPLDGTFNLAATATDDVGHTATATPVTLTADAVVPAISNVTTNATRFSAVNGYNALTLTFDCGKALTTDTFSAKAWVGSYPLTCGAYQSSTPNYTCTYTFTGNETTTVGTTVTPINTLPQAVMPIYVKVVDQVGNTGTGTSSVTADFTSPALAVPLSVTYRPGSVGVVSNVTAARDGSSIAVAVTSDEPLGAVPSLTSSPGGLVFSDSGASAGATSYVFTAPVATGSPADGTYALQIFLTDQVGNTATVAPASPDAVVDTTPPAAPDTSTSNLVTFTRKPEGDASSSTASYTVSGGAGATSANALVLVMDGSDPAQSSLIEHGTADGSGAFNIALNNVDRSTVYVATQDEAGNISTTANLVHDVYWTGSFIGKTPGNTQGNPNILDGATDFLVTSVGSWLYGPLTQPTGTSGEVPDYSGVTGLGDSVLSVPALPQSSAPNLQQLWNTYSKVGAAVSSREMSGMAYDAVRGRIVLFGGEDSNGFLLNDTWEFNGSTWSNVTSSSVNPPGRYRPAMAYDAATGQTVVFGGASNTMTFDDDTWEWDGTTWTRVSSQNSPSAREGASMAFDAAHGRLVLFGGHLQNGNTSTVYGDTWEFDGNAWTEVTPASGNPPVRYGAAMAYDAARQEVLMFGGFDNSTSMNDLWAWNGTNWTNVTPGSGSPSVRHDATMVYDAQAGVDVLFGGSSGSSYYGGTFTWNGTQWTSVSTSGPAARSTQSMAYDSNLGRTVLFGGADNSTVYGDAWEWNGTSWSDVSPASSMPEPRFGHATAYDSTLGQTVLYGGYNGGGLGDTWTWDGIQWTQFNVMGPPARYEHSMAYDPIRQETIVFGGYQTPSTGAVNDTWAWNGTQGIWTHLTPGTSPPPRYDAAMVFDTAQQEAVLFGGHNTGYLNDTWTWNGSTWSTKTYGGSPSIREGEVMAYDSGRNRVVLFGGDNGSTDLNDTWEWDGTNWTQMIPANGSPPARHWAAMSYDSTLGRTVLVGGEDHTGATLSDIWTWDGASWTEVTASPAPPPRNQSAMVYDSTQGCLVLIGGQDATGTSLGDVAESDSDPDRRAGEIAVFDFGRATAGDLLPITIESMTFDAYAGGTGYSLAVPGEGVEQDGATLAAWDAWNGAWKSLKTNTVSASAGTLPDIQYTTTSSTEAERYLLSGSQTINFGVFSSSGQGNGSQQPTASLDFAQLTVHYHH